MGPTIKINIKKGKDLGAITTYEIDNGIRVVNAISALEHLLQIIKERSPQHAVNQGINKESPKTDMDEFFANQMLEDIF